jgi:hypothetical protein
MILGDHAEYQTGSLPMNEIEFILVSLNPQVLGWRRWNMNHESRPRIAPKGLLSWDEVRGST